MSDQPIDAEDAKNAVKSKLTSESGQNRAALEMAVVEAEDPPPQIFKLNIDCYEAVADWLSLRDLHSFGQTCTRHQQAAGYIFKEVYPAARAECTKNGIYSRGIQVNGFCDYIQHLIIGTDHLDCFRFIESHSFVLLKRIRFYSIDLTDEKIACIKELLKKAEHVELTNCNLDGEFHDKFLQFCESMKRLTVRAASRDEDMEHEDLGIIIGTSNDWLLRQYPKLEHFEKTRSGLFGETPRKQLKMFLQRNPNIRHFATDAFKLWEKEDDVRMKLDILAISCIDDSVSSYIAAILQEYSKLDETKRFFKRFHIYLHGIMDQRRFEQLTASNQTEKLYIRDSTGQIGSSSLNKLKEIRVKCGPGFLVNGHPDLERVSLTYARLEDILAFIRGSPKLTKLRLESFSHTVQENKRILDLLTLNNQRATLNRARKVVIYVEEDVFLATKWATHTTEYSLIRLERDQSHDWNHDFGR